MHKTPSAHKIAQAEAVSMAVEVPRINGAAPEQDAKGQCQPFPFVETRGTAVERKSWREKRWREKRQPFPAVRREALGHSRRRCWSPGAVCRARKPRPPSVGVLPPQRRQTAVSIADKRFSCGHRGAGRRRRRRLPLRPPEVIRAIILQGSPYSPRGLWQSRTCGR